MGKTIPLKVAVILTLLINDKEVSFFHLRGDPSSIYFRPHFGRGVQKLVAAQLQHERINP